MAATRISVALPAWDPLSPRRLIFEPVALTAQLISLNLPEPVRHAVTNFVALPRVMSSEVRREPDICVRVGVAIVVRAVTAAGLLRSSHPGDLSLPSGCPSPATCLRATQRSALVTPRGHYVAQRAQVFVF